MDVALRDCNSRYHINHKDNRSCAVIWGEIEEAASMISKIDRELMLIQDNDTELWDDSDCWDDIECKMYDV